jgi:hypothetical protein
MVDYMLRLLLAMEATRIGRRALTSGACGVPSWRVPAYDWLLSIANSVRCALEGRWKERGGGVELVSRWRSSAMEAEPVR